MSGVRDVDREYHSFQEYQRRFYPPSTEDLFEVVEDPYLLGVELAKRSLGKFKHLLLRRRPRA